MNLKLHLLFFGAFLAAFLTSDLTGDRRLGLPPKITRAYQTKNIATSAARKSKK
jgi:hypothetical protein